MHQLQSQIMFLIFSATLSLSLYQKRSTTVENFQSSRCARALMRFRISGCLEDQSSIQSVSSFTVSLLFYYLQAKKLFFKIGLYLFSALELICSNCNETTASNVLQHKVAECVLILRA